MFPSVWEGTLIISMSVFLHLVILEIEIESEVIIFDSPPSSAAIPALQPIVHDLFVLRGSNKADAGKELDTQKEVVVSMLLRLVQYHQVVINGFKKSQHANVKVFQSVCFLPDICFYMCAAGVGDVHPCTAAVSQRE